MTDTRLALERGDTRLKRLCVPIGLRALLMVYSNLRAASAHKQPPLESADRDHLLREWAGAREWALRRMYSEQVRCCRVLPSGGFLHPFSSARTGERCRDAKARTRLNFELYSILALASTKASRRERCGLRSATSACRRLSVGVGERALGCG